MYIYNEGDAHSDRLLDKIVLHTYYSKKTPDNPSGKYYNLGFYTMTYDQDSGCMMVNNLFQFKMGAISLTKATKFRDTVVELLVKDSVKILDLKGLFDKM